VYLRAWFQAAAIHLERAMNLSAPSASRSPGRIDADAVIAHIAARLK
jgi:hypothetical protein